MTNRKDYEHFNNKSILTETGGQGVRLGIGAGDAEGGYEEHTVFRSSRAAQKIRMVRTASNSKNKNFLPSSEARFLIDAGNKANSKKKMVKRQCKKQKDYKRRQKTKDTRQKAGKCGD